MVSRSSRSKRRQTSKNINYRGVGTALVPLNQPTWGGFPVRLRTTLKYRDSCSINPAAGSLGYALFRANGVYDPNQTATGHQPLGYDVLTQVYQHTCVLRSTIKATFMSTEASAQQLCTCGIVPHNSGAPTTALVSAITEQGNAVYKHISALSTAWGFKATVRHGVDVAQWFGVVDVLDNDDLCADVGANPTDLVEYMIFVGPSLETADVGAFQIFVEIEYDVQFMEPKDLSQS